MMTEAKHPRHKYGLGTGRFSERANAGDWMGFNTGDRVCRKDDPRHCGRVEAILWSSIVKVRWDDSNWIEEVPLAELVKHVEE